jgi:signal transduction histidine kinase
VIFPPAAAAVSVAFWPMWRDRPLLALGNEFLSLALLAAGILLLDEPDQQGPAAMLFGSSALLTAGWLEIWHTGPLPLISVPASPAGIVLASWAMFRYPNSPRETEAGRRFFTAILVALTAGEVVCIVISRPQWSGFPPSAWWPTLMPDRALFTAVSRTVDVLGILFAVAYMLLWIRRWKRSHGISRRLAIPVAVAASVICGATIAELAAAAMSAGPETMNRIYTVESYLQIGVPAAFVVSVMRRRFTRARIAQLLVHLRGPARTSSITDALRAVFEDPALAVIGSAPGSEPATYTGTPQTPGGHPHGRLRLPVISSSGNQLAVILADPSLSPNDDLVRAAVAATSFELENAQLEAALREQLQEVRASRLRIIQAAIAERRRLERDLHDGIQQRLLGLKIMLAAAENDTTDRTAQVTIGRIRNELAQVLDEIRDLAHGIHPAALSQVGLEQAVKSMAERYPVPIDVSLPAGQFGDAAELTAYYLIAESITNAIKHAHASRITIRGGKSGGWLWITVTDNGQGGARIATGTGIRGIIDRVRGIGGELELDSPAGHGTVIRAQIPCA